MFKVLLFVVSFFYLCPSIFGQITLGPANNYSVGTFFVSNTQGINNTNVFDVGEAGENITWDFSDLDLGTTSSGYAKDKSEVPNSASFPAADIAFSDGSSQSFFSNTTTAKSFHGAFTASGAEIIYTDPQDLLRYPMTYQEDYTDTFSGTVFTNTLLDRKGTAAVSCDAYGTLITPAGTFNNVIRVKTVMDYGDFLGAIDIQTYYEEKYTWHNTIEEEAILSIILSDFGFAKLTTISYLEGTSTAIKTPLAASTFKTFPNPAADHFYLQLKDNGTQATSLMIHNQMGQMVYQQDNLEMTPTNQSLQLNLPTLTNGTYFVTLFEKGQLIGREKLILLGK